MMADSGARGSISNSNQLAGMRGNISNTSGKTIEIPIRANYREGLTILEYFISSEAPGRAWPIPRLRTADSGYLTRRLVDVSQEVIIRRTTAAPPRAWRSSTSRTARVHRALERASDWPVLGRGLLRRGRQRAGFQAIR